MLASATLVVLLFSGALGSIRHESRIVSGISARVGDFPFAVALQWRGSRGGNFCGGSILDENRILTSARCVHLKSTDDVQVQYGVVDSHDDRNIRYVKEILVHEGFYNGGIYQNDIAILTLKESMILDGLAAKATKLPDAALNIPNDSIEAQLCGWGYRTTEDQDIQRTLQWFWVPIQSDDVCNQHLGVAYDPNFHICAGSLDGTRQACDGDDGSPITVDGVQFGIVSWAYKPCRMINKPGLYTSVFKQRGWIRAKTGL